MGHITMRTGRTKMHFGRICRLIRGCSSCECGTVLRSFSDGVKSGQSSRTLWCGFRDLLMQYPGVSGHIMEYASLFGSLPFRSDVSDQCARHMFHSVSDSNEISYLWYYFAKTAKDSAEHLLSISPRDSPYRRKLAEEENIPDFTTMPALRTAEFRAFSVL